jgi:hypothetical protein
MANNMHKQEWIETILNSTKGMSRATPPADLYEKITSGINDTKTVRIIPIPVKQWAAAATLLLALNVGSVLYFTSHSKSVTNTANSSGLAAEMQLEIIYNY